MCGFVVLMKVVKSTLDMLPVSNTINAAQVRSRVVEMRLREDSMRQGFTSVTEQRSGSTKLRHSLPDKF